jgi:hypothetical protein
MTTYLVPLFTTITNTTTNTTTIVRSSAEDGDEEASYVVELVLPSFNESLYYDPSICLGVLLARNDRGDGGSSSGSEVGLIAGVAVAIPLAVALVLLVIGAALAVGWHRKRLACRSAGSINFEGGDDAHDGYQL